MNADCKARRRGAGHGVARWWRLGSPRLGSSRRGLPSRRGTLSCCVVPWLSALLLASCGGDTPEASCEPAPGTICSVVGSGLAGFSGDGAAPEQAELYLPMDVTVGPDDRLYIADWNNHRIRVVDANRARIETVAGTGLLGDGPNGPALEADFNHPTQVLFDASGDMLIAAWHNSRIKHLDMDTGRLSDRCGTGARAYTGDGGPAARADLDLPAGLAFHPDGSLLVVDQANQVIRRIDEAGTITRFAGTCLTAPCESGQTPVDCPDTSKQTCGDPAETCALPCQPAYGGDGGPALEARFAMPFGQAADPAGRLAVADDGTVYLADTRNHRIRRIDPDGTVRTLAGTGARGNGGADGPAEEAQLDNPVDLALAEDGTLYVTDTFNACVRAIDPDGMIRTVAGVCGMRGFSGDGGPPDEALLDRPYGIALDGEGNLYIADTHNQRVRLVMF